MIAQIKKYLQETKLEWQKVAIDSATFEHGIVGSICNKDNCAIILGRSGPGGKKNKYASAAAEKSHSVPPGMYFHEKRHVSHNPPLME